MRIASILREKGSDVATIRPDATVIDASRELADHGVGALLVCETDGRLSGIISERDLARSLAIHGEAALAKRVADLMTHQVTTCTPDDTVDELMAVMTERRVRHLPVLDEGRLAGIISIGDVVKHRVGELEQENVTLHDYIETGR